MGHDKNTTLESVKNYYGKILSSTSDLKTSACCSLETMPKNIGEICELIHEEVRSKFYGCGLVIPGCLEGATVLDLGCGSGRDVYILSKLVGESGRVIGVDMTAEQLQVARRHQDFQAKQFGYKKSNVSFLEGYIEDLESIGIESGSIDVVVSNCVVNLSPDKERVFREVRRVLKDGGEFYYSDVFADRRLSEKAKLDPILVGECLGGALYSEDFRRILNRLGVADFRLVASSPIDIRDSSIQEKVGLTKFKSMTQRIFKLDLEDKCEDYGQVAYYKGTIAGLPHGFKLDDHHFFETDRPHTVCSNTALMLTGTRYGSHFRITGDVSQHFGLFPCGPTNQNAEQASGVGAPMGACC